MKKILAILFSIALLVGCGSQLDAKQLKNHLQGKNYEVVVKALGNVESGELVDTVAAHINSLTERLGATPDIDYKAFLSEVANFETMKAPVVKTAIDNAKKFTEELMISRDASSKISEANDAATEALEADDAAGAKAALEKVKDEVSKVNEKDSISQSIVSDYKDLLESANK